MYYNHPLHGDPTPEEVQEFVEHCQDTRWQCHECGRWHPEYHKACWHCHPTVTTLIPSGGKEDATLIGLEEDGQKPTL